MRRSRIAARREQWGIRLRVIEETHGEQLRYGIISCETQFKCLVSAVCRTLSFFDVAIDGSLIAQTDIKTQVHVVIERLRVL